MALRNFWLISNQVRSLLEKKATLLWTRIQPTSNLTPMGGGFGELFKKQTILNNLEVIPVIMVAVISVVATSSHCIRCFIRMSDIHLLPRGKMPCQKHHYICEDASPPVIKYRVINQKYEWPQGLLDALCEEKSPEKCEKKAKRVSFRFWKKAKEPDMDDSDDE